MEKVSIIRWSDYIDDCAPNEDLLVYVRDDSGDYTHYYITIAYHIADNLWIKDNEKIYGEVLMWARIPECEDIKEII